jgi:hypothetical protein
MISDLHDDLKPYWNYREELYTLDGIVFKGDWIIIPAEMRKYIINLLHESHMGIDKTRSRARRVVFWPNINADLEEMIKKCNKCQENSRNL